MLIRVKDFGYNAIRDNASLFGDAGGDDWLSFALIDGKQVDPEKKQFQFVATDDSVDRDDEIIKAGAFHELRSQYLRAPVILANHQQRLSTGLSPAIGRTLKLATERNPVTGLGQFIDTAAGRDHAQAVYAGAQRGVSVGFRTVDTDRSSGRLVITKGLLLEISLVSVPANPNALVLNYVQGRLDERGRSIGDPVESDEWHAMVRELHDEIDKIKADLGVQTKGRRLAARLNELIDARITDDRSRADIVQAMGRAAGIDAGTVNEILEGSIDCPPLRRLQGFASVLDATPDELRRAAEQDGCNYGERSLSVSGWDDDGIDEYETHGLNDETIDDDEAGLRLAGDDALCKGISDMIADLKAS